ncbi:hypothetical protein TIFTF001_021272 [Ficus carica]|uniref:Uncharacterized protein n=1 Tax=Ficus carica TaxID=3494 RepID=A0AA88AGD6_FICCA|nr:hypothetical protein TIFTF001_021272 [Ficus carica]
MKGGKMMTTTSPAMIALVVVVAACLASPAFARTIDEDMVHAIMLRGQLGDRCRVPGEYCHVMQLKICCEGLYCTGSAFGEDRKCVPYADCRKQNEGCSMTVSCCYPFNCNAPYQGVCQ